jgi:phosphatidylserine/phosphatidylglycerophosphate/cardiolipin synthase-like enzyme
LAELAPYKAEPLPAGYPANLWTGWAPVDNLHGALLALVESAEETLVLAMFALDDESLAQAVAAKIAAGLSVAITLDESQAKTPEETRLLGAVNFPADITAIGTSSKGQIMHLKCCVVDGRYTITGSTNWTSSGESTETNQLTVIDDPVVAADALAQIATAHAWIVAHPPSDTITS